jgi:hypothetical protein
MLIDGVLRKSFGVWCSSLVSAPACRKIGPRFESWLCTLRGLFSSVESHQLYYTPLTVLAQILMDKGA